VCGGPACNHEQQRNSKYRYYRCVNTVPRTNRSRTCDAQGVRVSVLEPRAWEEVCKVIQDPEMVVAELRNRQAGTTAREDEIARIQTTIKTLDAQKQRALRLFTIAEADDTDVKRELARIDKLYMQALSRQAELEPAAPYQLNSNRWPKSQGVLRPDTRSPRPTHFRTATRGARNASSAIHARKRPPVAHLVSASN